MSTLEDDPEFQTSKGRILGLALMAGGLGLFAYALVAIVGFFTAISSHVAVVHFDGGGWIAFPIAIVWLILGGAILFGGKGAAEPGHPRRVLITRLLRWSVGLLAVAVILPLATYWTAGAYLEERGYQACSNEQLGLRSISRTWEYAIDLGDDGAVSEDCSA